MSQTTQEQLQAARTQCVCRQADLIMTRGRFERFDLATASADQLEIIREVVLQVFDVAEAAVKAEEALLDVVLGPLQAASSN